MEACTDDHQLAAALASEAAVALLRLRSSGLEGVELRDEGDRIANRALLEGLAVMRPDDGILSEESADSGARLEKKRVWILDPLDGSREFSEPDRDDWAVHVALAVDGRPQCAAVALPARGELVSTANPPQLHRRRRSKKPIVVASRTRPPDLLGPLADFLDFEVRPMGSAGAKAMAVVRGDADAYIHAGGQYEWDSCAPVAVALAAGLHASRLDGGDLIYNREDPYLSDLIVCDPLIADRLLGAIASLGLAE